MYSFYRCMLFIIFAGDGPKKIGPNTGYAAIKNIKSLTLTRTAGGVNTV